MLLSVERLSFQRGSRVIFDEVSLSFERGEITAVMGPSGIGKSTMLWLLTGVLRPSSGCVRFEGEVVHEMRGKALRAYRKRLGFLFQNSALFTDLSVFDNVAFPLREEGLAQEEVSVRTLSALESVGLKGARDLMPSELSGGMTRRVALARAVVTRPEVVFFDEPFTGQDPISKGVLVQLISSLRTQGISSVLVSHDLKETLQLADRVYILSKAKVVASGSAGEVTASKDPFVVQFLQGNPDGPIAFRYPERAQGALS